jgi:hypothetical protein
LVTILERFRIRTELAAVLVGTRVGIEIRGSRPVETAWRRTARSAGWTKPTGRSRTWAGSKSPTPSRGRWSSLLSTGFINRKRSPSEWLIVKEADGFLSLCRVGELYEGKSTFSSRLAVERDKHIQDVAGGGEMRANIFFVSVVGKISHE